MDITKLSLKEKVKLLKNLVDDLDIVLTACYGASETITSDDVDIATYDDKFHDIKKDHTVVISTNIMTG